MGGSATPAELIAVADALGDFSDRLDKYIKALPSPFTPEAVQLRQMDAHIASDAANISELAVAAMAAEVRTALNGLQTQIDSAKTTLAAITNVKTALSIAAAVFSVAANLSTGNPLGAATSVIALGQTIANAVSASQS